VHGTAKGRPPTSGLGGLGDLPLELRGASGALDKEHEHHNLPTRGSHIKTHDLSRDVLPQPNGERDQRAASRAPVPGAASRRLRTSSPAGVRTQYRYVGETRLIKLPLRARPGGIK
jgi:hypothetical protein